MNSFAILAKALLVIIGVPFGFFVVAAIAIAIYGVANLFAGPDFVPSELSQQLDSSSTN